MGLRSPLRASGVGGHPLVDQASDLTPAWLTAVLRAAGLLPAGRVVAAKCEPIGNGMVATTVRLHLSYDAPSVDAPATLVAKMTSVHEASRKAGLALSVYEKEVRFSTRTSKQIDALPWMNRPRDVSLYAQGYRARMGLVMRRYAHALRADARDVVAQFGECIERYYAQQPRPWTITHQDFRLDNLLFDAKGGTMPVAVLDWQTVRIGPGVSDVAYFIGAGLSLELRRTHERRLLEAYRSRLCGLGVAGFTAGQAWEQYRLFAAEGLITAILGAAMVTPTERGDRMFIAMIERHAQHMLDLGTLSLIH